MEQEVPELSWRAEEVGADRYAVVPRIEPKDREILDKWRDFYRRQGTPYVVVLIGRGRKQNQHRWRLYIRRVP